MMSQIRVHSICYTEQEIAVVMLCISSVRRISDLCAISVISVIPPLLFLLPSVSACNSSLPAYSPEFHHRLFPGLPGSYMLLQTLSASLLCMSHPLSFTLCLHTLYIHESFHYAMSTRLSLFDAPVSRTKF